MNVKEMGIYVNPRYRIARTRRREDFEDYALKGVYIQEYKNIFPMLSQDQIDLLYKLVNNGKVTYSSSYDDLLRIFNNEVSAKFLYDDTVKTISIDKLIAIKICLELEEFREKKLRKGNKKKSIQTPFLHLFIPIITKMFKRI